MSIANNLLILQLKIVVKALTAAKGRIIKAVEDEIKWLNTPDKDFLDEVNKEILCKLPELLKVLGIKLWIYKQCRQAFS